jgi:tripartite-type tricarboxylate transporter receptor subunit TctC
MTISRRGTVAGLAALPIVGSAAAQTFPNKTLTMVVPFPAGGPADIFGRNLAQAMSPILGQQIVIENKSGAAGVTGVDFVAKASDAHTIGLMSASAGAIMQHLMPKMPFDNTKDVSALTIIVRVQEVLAVNSKLGINDFKSFVAAAKARPGKITAASAGSGGITHLAIELLKREAGIDILHVPYRGAAPATNDLLAGTVDSTLLDITILLSHARTGAVKVLGVTSDTRAQLLPDVPTFREMGLPKVNSDNWYVLIAPGAAPLADRMKIHAAALQALKSKPVVDAYAAVGGVATTSTPEETEAFLRGERVKWGEVVKAANVKLE